MKYEKNIEIAQATRSLHMEILEVCHAYLDTGWNYNDVTHSFSQIHIPLSGHGQYIVGEDTIDLLPGKVYLLPAGVTYSYRCENRLEMLLIDFSLTRPDGVDIFLGTDNCLIFDDAAGFSVQLQEICSCADLHSAVKLRYLVHKIVDMALDITTINTNIPSYSPITKKALQFIDRHLSADLTITQIAEQLFVSKLTLQKHFKEEIGRPIGKYITERVMARAERRLLESGKSIHEIANQLGFCDQFYFSRVFTQHYGISPNHFRQKHRK